jgi:hypothetical protein
MVPSRLLAGEFQATYVSVNAHRLPRGTDTENELESNGPDAAAHIEALHGLADANSPKERFGRRPLRTGEELQPLDRLVAASKDVGIGFVGHDWSLFFERCQDDFIRSRSARQPSGKPARSAAFGASLKMEPSETTFASSVRFFVSCPTSVNAGRWKV